MEWRVPHRTCCPGRKEIGFAERGETCFEGIPVPPQADVNVFPVVETGALNLALFEREAERFDQMQSGCCGQARSPHISGIPMDLRLDQDDVSLLRSFHVIAR